MMSHLWDSCFAQQELDAPFLATSRRLSMFDSGVKQIDCGALLEKSPRISG